MARSVLVVDDSFTSRWLIKREILSMDPKAKVHEAGDGLEARELLKTLKPQILITTLQLSRLNGLTLLKKIARTEKKDELPKVILLHEFNHKALRDALTNLPLLGFLTKPVKLEDLIKLWPKESSDG